MENNDVKFLVVHCSDTPNSENLNANDIHKMHISFGWDGIGYHKVILRNGILEAGRPEYWEGAHVYGYNDKSLGVCLIGKDQFTSVQFRTLQNLLKNWNLNILMQRSWDIEILLVVIKLVPILM